MLRRPLPHHPRRIILIKSHSAGIGDILRSSAAWAVLKKRWPDAELHLIFLTRWPGYPSEELISGHHLLHSAHFLPLQESRFAGMRGVGPKGWRSLLPELRRLGREIRPDLIVDHEPHGIETAIASRILRAQSHHAATVGVAQVLGRGLFYDHAGPSFARYARERALPLPMDYTERDFAALAALGLEREEQQINLIETEAGRVWRLANLSRFDDRHVLGLNIGCGTPGAEYRRPSIDLLVESLGPVYLPQNVVIVLSGSPAEKYINMRFISDYRRRWGGGRNIIDYAGMTSLGELTGLISGCHVFVSSDSGPYHMSVALAVPTVVLFQENFPSAYHKQRGVHILVAPTTDILGDLLFKKFNGSSQ